MNIRKKFNSFSSLKIFIKKKTITTELKTPIKKDKNNALTII